jgi:hypothetical protein
VGLGLTHPAPGRRTMYVLAGIFQLLYTMVALVVIAVITAVRILAMCLAYLIPQVVRLWGLAANRVRA